MYAGHFSKITYESSVANPAVEEGTKKKTHDAVLNFKVTAPKTGRNNDATFGKFASLYEGDKYVTPKAAQLQAEAESRKLNINDKPFRQVSPMKKSTTPGDWHGTISGKIPYEPTSAEPIKLKKGDVPPLPRGIFTSPAKKGTFGMNKFTLSEKVGYKGAQGEYEYLHDPESDLKKKKKEEMEAHKKACTSEQPFKPSNMFAAQRINKIPYIIAPPLPEGEAAKPVKVDTVPFKPPAAGFRPPEHIEYIHDPEAPKIAARREKRMQEHQRLAATGPWRPNLAADKSDMVRSVVKMNIGRV